MGIRQTPPRWKDGSRLGWRHSKPLTSAHGVAGESALGRAVGFSNSGGLGCNRFGLGDRGVGGGGQGVRSMGAFGGDSGYPSNAAPLNRA